MQSRKRVADSSLQRIHPTNDRLHEPAKILQPRQKNPARPGPHHIQPPELRQRHARGSCPCPENAETPAPFMDTWFITANDTGVGKTVLTVLLARALDNQGAPFRAVKPFCSGGRADARALHRAQRRRLPLDAINPWHFRPALAPAVAAGLRGQTISRTQVGEFLRASRPGSGPLLIEGAGGLLTPLGPGYTARELIQDTRATPLVVCSNRLGVINQARLVWEALPTSSRRRARVILMDSPNPDSSAKTNLAALSAHIDPSRIHRLPWLFQGVWAPLDSEMSDRVSQLLR